QHHILVVTEPWCGDSLAIFPVIAKLFTAAGCEVRVIRRDEHTDLMDQFLTNGGRAIPIVIILDDQFETRFHWGPRPKPAQDIIMDHKAAIAAGEIDKADVHKQVRAFYARDHGKTIVAEFAEAFSRL
ncbi:thioredoxin family protein, partial [Candidatus Bipolaricaulota bacterium]|nr:thioredoxin family protein [Candidatus Bipolaricaulota bacterium]